MGGQARASGGHRFPAQDVAGHVGPVDAAGDRTAAAISARGTPVAAASPASWLAASAEDSPSRSISTPLAIATTDSLGGRGADAIKLTPLMVDDRDQPQHVIIAARHDHPLPWAPSPAYFSHVFPSTVSDGASFSGLALLQKSVRPMIVTSGLPSG